MKSRIIILILFLFISPLFPGDFTFAQSNRPTLSNFNQFKSDQTTPISESAITTEDIAVFQARISHPNGFNVKLQVELKEFHQDFNGQDILESSFLSSGSTVTITRYGLVKGEYKWRARAVDINGVMSDWQEFGTPGNVDFEIKLVPLYTQIKSPYPSDEETKSWFDKPYAKGVLGNYDCGSTIADCGCAITSAVMILRFHNITTAIDNNDVNPQTFNNWLVLNKGYDAGDLDWEKIDKYSKDPETGFRRLHYVGPVNFEDTDTLNAHLKSIQPVILKTYPIVQGEYSPHFIVADGQLVNTYTIKDPAWYNTRKLSQAHGVYVYNYNNNFSQLRLFTPVAIARGVLHIHLASPAELLITDPQGRKLGKNPIVNIEYSEIPGGVYYLEGIGNPFAETPTPVEESKNIWIPDPIDGRYNVKIIGTGLGSYTADFSLYDQAGQSEDIAQEGTTTINNIQEFELNYSKETIEEVELYRIVGIDIKPDSDPNSINCKNLKEVIPVAILTTALFNAATIDADTIRFGPNAAQEIHRDKNGKAKRHLEDVDKDGDLDLVFHFRFSDTGIQCGDQTATLTGKTLEGFDITGTDYIRTVGNNKQAFIGKLLGLLANVYEVLPRLL